MGSVEENYLEKLVEAMITIMIMTTIIITTMIMKIAMIMTKQYSNQMGINPSDRKLIP